MFKNLYDSDLWYACAPKKTLKPQMYIKYKSFQCYFCTILVTTYPLCTGISAQLAQVWL